MTSGYGRRNWCRAGFSAFCFIPYYDTLPGCVMQSRSLDARFTKQHPTFTSTKQSDVKVIITGTTGMVGEGVLLECLQNPAITEVLSVSRKSTGRTHAKLKEYIVKDFLALQENDPRLAGYDACFFCAGVSSVGKKEDEYTRITYDTTLNFARATGPNPKMTFVYVSGDGTDSTEQGRLMWARVKGKTENDLMKLPFKQALGFRPGIMVAMKGQNHVLPYYKYFTWLFPVLRVVAPGIICNLQQVAQAMICAAQYGYEKNIVEVKDIKIMAQREVNV